MALFHEMYGVYYRIAAKLLEREKLTVRELYKQIERSGFRDSVLFLPQKLLPQEDGSDWGLLRHDADGMLRPVTRHRPPHPVTQLQKRWLRALLEDPRMGLFLDENRLQALRRYLHDVPPLFRREQFGYTDQFSDGDPYSDRHYARSFRLLLRAVWEQEILDISYRSAKGKRFRMRCVPFRIEYSEKNDKFRVYCVRLRGMRPSGCFLMNLGRILSLCGTGEFWEEKIPVRNFFRLRMCSEPVTVRVRNERNAVERFLMEFACYEKRTERDPESGDCEVKLWYDRQDETELLIRLLSFGPMLEITAPVDFRKKAAERIRQQAALL